MLSASASRFDQRLLLGGLAIAGLDIAVAGCAWITGWRGPSRIALVVSLVALAGLFTRLVIDPTAHRAVEAAQRDMKAKRPWYRSPAGLLDSTWGLFGSRTGPPVLIALRTVLLVGFILLSANRGRHHHASPEQLLFTVGFAITILLSLMQLKDHYAAEGD